MSTIDSSACDFTLLLRIAIGEVLVDVRHYSMLILSGTHGQLVFEELVERRSVPICIEAYHNTILHHNHHNDDDEVNGEEDDEGKGVRSSGDVDGGHNDSDDPQPHVISAYHIPKPAEEIAFLPCSRGIEVVPWVVVTSQAGLARLNIKNPNLGGKYVERIKYTWSTPIYKNNNGNSGGSTLTRQGMTVSTVNDDKTSLTTAIINNSGGQLYTDFLYGCFTKYLELIDFDSVTVVRGFLTSAFINEIDLSALRNVTSASMLLGCQHLTSLDMSPMTKLTTITGLCSGCTSLSSINLHGLENVTTIGGQFLSSTPITHIDLSPLRNVRSIGIQFLAWCGSLTTVVDLALFVRRKIKEKENNNNTFSSNLPPSSSSSSVPSDDEEDAVALGDNFMANCMNLDSGVFRVLGGRKVIPPNVKVELAKLQ